MGKEPDNNLVCRGPWGTIRYAICFNGRMPSQDFLSDLSIEDQAKFLALFDRMAQVGQIRNREQFKKVEGRIFEFKRFQIRVGCFQSGNSWVLTHGFVKKKNRWPKAELERAERIRREHLESRGT